MSKKTGIIDLGFLQEQAAHTDLSGMFAASVATESEMLQAAMVKIDRLLNNPYQPRVETADLAIDELAQVIKAQGFQGVLIARPDPVNKDFYQLTAGHRRREASRRAGLSTLPVVVRDLTEEEMVTLAITENIQREDLSPLEEGKIYLLMIDEMGYTHEQVASEVGKKRGYIENRLRVARATPDVQSMVQSRSDTLRAVSYLVKVEDAHERGEVIEHLMNATLTADDVPGFIKSQKGSVTPPATKDTPEKISHKGRKQRSEPEATAARPATQTIESLPRTNGQQDPAERDTARVGTAKLTTVLRYLNNYQKQAQSRESISAQEQANLAIIKSLAEELYNRYCQEPKER